MVEPLSVPAWQVAVVLALPLLYILHSFAPWSQRLFGEGDHSAYNRVWGTIGLLHWASVAVVVAILAGNGHTLADIGVRVPAAAWLGVTLVAAVAGVGGFLLVVPRAPPIPAEVLDMPEDAPFPRSGAQRVVCFTSGVVTAGIAEEFVYRGFAVTALVGLGLPPVGAVVAASVPFVFVHGLAPVKAPVLVPVYLGFGIVFGGIFLLSGSLLPGMALHGAINGLQIVTGTRAATGADAGAESAVAGPE